jgi:predicted XRE-type DNA-binding protein
MSHDKDDDLIIDSSGSVYADIGLTLSEDDSLKISIARAISEVIQSGNYTQEAAAKVMGLDQPKVSKLLRGRLKEFRAQRLIECLLKLGFDIELRVQKSVDKRGKVRLVA